MTPTEYHLRNIISRQSDLIEKLERQLEEAMRVVRDQNKLLEDKAKVDISWVHQFN